MAALYSTHSTIMKLSHSPYFVATRKDTSKRRLLFSFSQYRACTMERDSSRRVCQSSSESFSYRRPKKIWIWTKCKEVMTTAIERGWNSFIFESEDRKLAIEWSSIAMFRPIFLEKEDLRDSEGKKVGSFVEVSTPDELLQLHDRIHHSDNIIVNFIDWQIIPAENILAAFQSSSATLFAISRTAAEAKIFLETLELGLEGVVLKTENIEAILDLKDFLNKREQSNNSLLLTTAVVTEVQSMGKGDRVCVDLCCIMRAGEGLLVGSFARGLFLVHSECLESNYIASRPFRVNAGPVHSYVKITSEKTAYLSELKAGREVLVSDQTGMVRTAIIGRVKVETRPLVMVTAKLNSDDSIEYSVFLQSAETVGLVGPSRGEESKYNFIPVTALDVGDEVMMHIQGGARHTGIEIQEFIVEK